MVLLDTSVWIAAFRKAKPLELQAVVDFEEITTCLPVIQEVLQGFCSEAAFRAAREAMLSLPTVESPLGQATYDLAVDLYRTARSRGITVRSSVDCLIAACALRNDLEVIHHDRDFAQLARVSRLRQRSV